MKGISLTIKGGNKVGVVGRTGSGKSTLVLALFRLVEASGGRILVDGVDLSEIGLSDLRTRLSIIPQDPTLFDGTIRSNLDPTGQYSDQELWEVRLPEVLIIALYFANSLRGIHSFSAELVFGHSIIFQCTIFTASNFF